MYHRVLYLNGVFFQHRVCYPSLITRGSSVSTGTGSAKAYGTFSSWRRTVVSIVPRRTKQENQMQVRHHCRLQNNYAFGAGINSGGFDRRAKRAYF